MSVCGSRPAKHFRTSWMHARSSLLTLLPQHQWFHGHVQTLLPGASPKILKRYMLRALSTSKNIRQGSLQTAFMPVRGGEPWPRKWLHVPTHHQKVSWKNLFWTSCCRQTNSDRFLLLKRTQVTTYPNKYMVWALSNAGIPIKLRKSLDQWTRMSLSTKRQRSGQLQ